MTRPTPARRRSRTPGARTTLGALVALALVTTAGAPSLVTVQRGDTLWELARTHGTSERALRALNDLPGNGMIYAGQTLRVSGGSSAAPAAGARRHTIAPGETLSDLALRYGVSASALAEANDVSGDRIYAGRTLSIPGAGGGAGTSGASTADGGGRVPSSVRGSVAQNRRLLAARSHPSKAEVRQMVAATARRHGVSPSLAVAVAYHESGFQQRVVSGANAVGVMQVLPSTGEVLSRQHGQSLDLMQTQDNITAGVLLLRQLLRSEGTVDGALAGYYQGLGSIARQGVLPQTRDYVRIIAILRQRFPDG